MQSENNFKISLYQESDLICERIFDADVFSPAVRISVDIRKILPSIISKFQRGLSKKEYYNEYEVNEEVVYDFYEHRLDEIDKYPKSLRSEFFKRPEIKKQVIDVVNEKGENESKTITGVEFKFNFFINDKIIVERIFYVNGYNDEVKYSMDIYYLLNEISNQIYNYLKRMDVNHTWDDYYLINNYSMNIDQIRELPKEKRNELLYKLR